MIKKPCEQGGHSPCWAAELEKIIIILSENLKLFGAWLYVVLKLGHCRQQIRNTRKVLQYGTGEGWRRSVGLIV
jgi:hypothetical protein